MALAPRSSMAPDRAAGGQALLVIDMISCWDFPDADKLLPEALAIAPLPVSLGDAAAQGCP